ncbi:hypothetical protein P692DRAFT_201795756 [Suillus brevipes Sb2]|nr:hypothetical protein P692DRAFT_201795756 [Suillus brevipes Sb2]
MFADAADTAAEAYTWPTCGIVLNPARNSLWARYSPLAIFATHASSIRGQERRHRNPGHENTKNIAWM